MEIAKRQELTKTLQQMVGRIAADLRPRMLAPGHARARAEQLHADEKVGEAFDPWTDLLSRRAAVLWVLKTVYVRVLEDRGMLSPKRLVDQGSEDLFARLAPNLGPSSYLRWVFRDLAMPASGLPDLFVPQPAEIITPSDARSRELIDLWRSRDPDTGVLRFSFAEETFDSRLMGDLYQDLDPVVKKRFALLQTPDFVLDFILDQTLTPAIAEHGADVVRVLDPACGSGHFLLAALTRIVATMREKEPKRPAHEVVKHAMRRVVGIDLNDYACGLARARLVMKGLELAGDTNLALAEDLHPQVFWADGLEQIEHDQTGQTSLGLEVDAVGELRSTASMTRPEVRMALRPLLRARFHVVVGNPPYVSERDRQKKLYHREQIGKTRRYISATGRYSLGAPFTERMLQLSLDGAWVGEITANSFAKNVSGSALIETVLAQHQIVRVVDTSGAAIPGHGTDTVILFFRKLRSSGAETVPVVGAKRREPGRPTDPSQGRVWTSISKAYATIGYEDEYISVSAVPRASLNRHPWSIGGGGASELKSFLDGNRERIVDVVDAIGVGGMSNADEAFTAPAAVWERRGVGREWYRPIVDGETVRNWTFEDDEAVFFPYSHTLELVPIVHTALAALWPLRTSLWARAVFDGGTYRDVDRPWWEWHQLTTDRYRSPLTIVFAEIATHAEFALDRGGRVFKQSAPIIKLTPNATLDEHFALLGQLNSSIASFWRRQVCKPKGGSGVGIRGVQPEPWMERMQGGSTKMGPFPLATRRHALIEEFARELDALSQRRRDESVRAVVDRVAADGAIALRAALESRRQADTALLFRMVGLQEELDWLCYALYEVDTLSADLVLGAPVSASAVAPLAPGQRSFEISLARRDAERAGDDEEEEPRTAWFERHGWSPVLDIEQLPEPTRSITEARLLRTADSRELGLLEQPTFKRRWSRPKYDVEETAALTAWLDDAFESWASRRVEPFTARSIANALGGDRSVNGVVAVLVGRTDFDLESIVAGRLAVESIPGVKSHTYTTSGLEKRIEWERTWAAQRVEDLATSARENRPPVPPPYSSKDFVSMTFWMRRGAFDVPKERFIAYTEIPAPVSADPLYGWGGWTPTQRARVLLELDERAEEASVPTDERIGLLWGAWFLVPYIAWDNPAFANEVAASVKTYAGADGVTDARLAEWAEKHAVAKTSAPKKPKAPAKPRKKKGEAS